MIQRLTAEVDDVLPSTDTRPDRGALVLTKHVIERMLCRRCARMIGYDSQSSPNRKGLGVDRFTIAAREYAMLLANADDGEVVQDANTSDLLFGVRTLVSYISHTMSLSPGDVIATGTPGGSGHWRHPPRYLEDGNMLTTRVEGLGECRNVCRREPLP